MADLTLPTATPATLTPYDRVQVFRQAAGLSQRKLCEKAGLDPSQLAVIKRKGGGMAIETARKFASALGRTVAELMGEAPPAAPAPANTAAVYVAWHRLVPSPLNPRRSFDPEPLRELAESIAAQGVLTNLVVREIGGEVACIDPAGNRVPLLEILAGERRQRAIGLLVAEGRFDPDAERVPVRILQAGDGEALAIAILENLQRQDVPQIEEAEAFARLQAMDPQTWTTEAMAERTGMSLRTVQQRLQLVSALAPEVKDALRAKSITLAVARELLTVPLDQQPGMLGDITGTRAADARERVRTVVDRPARPAPPERAMPGQKPREPARREAPPPPPPPEAPSDTARLRDLAAQIGRWRKDKTQGIDHRAEPYLLALADRLSAQKEAAHG